MFDTLRRRQAAADAFVQEVFAAAGVGLCLVDADGRVVQANDAWLSAFGLTREVASGRLLWELLTCAPLELQRKLEVARSGTPVELPQHRQSTGEREAWLEGRLAPVHLEHGVGVLFTAVDVTEKKRAADALLRSEAELRISLANAAIGFARATPEGRILDVNLAYSTITGFTLEELRRKALLDVVHPDERPAAARQNERMLAGEVADFVLECRSVRKDGGLVWVRESVSLVRSPRGAPLWIIALVEDVTERRRAEEALRESEHRFRLALRNAPVSVAVQDRELRYVWAYNQRTARLEEILGRRDSDIFKPGEAAHIEEIKRRVLADGTEQREQMWLDRPSGRIFLDATFCPVRDAEGRVIGVGTATVDLTAMKLAEDALRENEQRISAICDHAPFAIALAQLPTRRLVKVNEAFVRLFEVPREQALGKTGAELGLLGEGEQARVSGELERLGRVDALEVERTTRSGERRVLSLSLEPVIIGGEGFVVTMAQDVTGRAPHRHG